LLNNQRRLVRYYCQATVGRILGLTLDHSHFHYLRSWCRHHTLIRPICRMPGDRHFGLAASRPRCSAAITFSSRMPSPSHLGQIMERFTVPTPLHKGHCAMFAVVISAQYSECQLCSEQKCTRYWAPRAGSERTTSRSCCGRGVHDDRFLYFLRPSLAFLQSSRHI